MADLSSDGVDAEAADDSVDTSNGEGGSDGLQVEDETGGVTDREIADALRGTGIKLKPTGKEADDGEAGSDGENTDGEADAGDGEDAEAAASGDDEADAGGDADGEEADGAAAGDKSADGVDEAAAAAASQFTFEVEDANGEKFVIDPTKSMEEQYPDFEPKNNGQIMDILEKRREMLEAKGQFEKDQENEAAQATRAEAVEKIQTGWNDEIKQLQGEKRIPVTVKGKDNEKVAEVYAFMGKENDVRIAAGKPTIGSFTDALDLMEARAARAAAVAADKAAKETSRTNGGKVGGSSAPAAPGGPVYRPGSAKNAGAAIREMGLLP